MYSEQTTQSKNIGTLVHASTFSKYFFPFGNFIFPLVLWMCHRKNFFIDGHAKQCLNFQISTFLYMMVLAFIGIFGTILFGINMADPEFIQLSNNIFRIQDFPRLLPFVIFIGIVLLLLLGLFLLEIVCVIIAAVKASEAKTYRYPLSIPFIRPEALTKETFTTFKK